VVVAKLFFSRGEDFQKTVIAVVAEVGFEAAQLEEFGDGFGCHIFREAGMGFAAFALGVIRDILDFGIFVEKLAVDVDLLIHNNFLFS